MQEVIEWDSEKSVKRAADYAPLVLAELERALTKHPIGFHTAHEGHSVIEEEYDEFWDEVMADNLTLARKEVTQLAAMCLRFLVDTERLL